MIFAVLLPFIAIVVVGGLLALFFFKHEIGKVRGLLQTASPTPAPKLPGEKPSAREFDTLHKPYKQSAQEEHPPENMNDENQGVSHPWRW